jgi:hypothetical protein
LIKYYVYFDHRILISDWTFRSRMPAPIRNNWNCWTHAEGKSADRSTFARVIGDQVRQEQFWCDRLGHGW